MLKKLNKLTKIIFGKKIDIMRTIGIKIISLVLLSGLFFALNSCGTKKVKEKPDYNKVDQAFDEYMEKNK